MTCEEIRAKLSEYLDGECDEAEEVAKHIESCPDCQKALERLADLSNSFGNFVEVPEKSIADSVVAKIRQEKMKKTPFFVRHIGLAASLVMILFIVLYTRIFPYDEMKDSAETGEPAGETVTLKAEILDTKNSAVLKDDVHFAVSDMSPFEEAEAEEAVTEEFQKSEPFADVKNEAPLSTSPEGTFEYAFLDGEGYNAVAILSSEFEVEKVDHTTLHIKTDNLQRVKELVGDTYEVFLENGVVVVKLK